MVVTQVLLLCGISGISKAGTMGDTYLHFVIVVLAALGLVCVLVTQSCLTLCDPTSTLGCSPPGPSAHGISQARILE